MSNHQRSPITLNELRAYLFDPRFALIWAPLECRTYMSEGGGLLWGNAENMTAVSRNLYIRLFRGDEYGT